MHLLCFFLSNGVKEIKKLVVSQTGLFAQCVSDFIKWFYKGLVKVIKPSAYDNGHILV